MASETAPKKKNGRPIEAPKRTVRPGDIEGDITVRHIERYHCIGPDCEDHCCHTWRVAVDDAHHKELKFECRRTSQEERIRFEQSFKRIREKKKVSWVMRMHDNGLCFMLEPNGLCHIHGTFGERFLPDVCATYPRNIRRMGPHLEMTGVVSCPEVARQLLLYEDANEVIRFDRRSLSRKAMISGFDPRDIRPYWRLLREVRDFVLGLLDRREYSIEKRLFFLTYFANKTSTILRRDVMKGDKEAVHRELTLLEDSRVLDEIARRVDTIETPSKLVLLLARELTRVRGGDTRDNFRELIDAIFAGYKANLKGLSEIDKEEDGEVARTFMTDQFWAEYRSRRDRVMERAGARVEQYLTNYAYYHWMHRLQLESPNVLAHTQRMLTVMAVHKFLLFSHPLLLAVMELEDEEIQAVGERAREAPTDESGGGVDVEFEEPTAVEDQAEPEAEEAAEPEAEEAAEPEGEQLPPVLFPPDWSLKPGDTFTDVLDRCAVEVYYKAGRFIEHSTLLSQLEKVLESRGLGGVAGALYLVRF